MISPAIFCLLIALSAAVAFPPSAPVDACASIIALNAAFALPNPVPFNVCATVRCPGGTRCIAIFNVQTKAFEAKCKRLKPKPGQCPKPLPGTVGICVEACTSDSDCQGKQKCCSNGCGHTCQNPVSVQPENPCKGFCKPGYVCREVVSPCIFPPCPTHPVCEKAGSESNPGQCPKLSSDQVGICVELCTSDSDCRRNEKCCSNGCGHTCQTTVHA